MPEPRKWFDPTQPQTLQAAVLFSYFNAALAVLSLILAGAGPALILLLGGVGANGIANEKRWGYRLALAVAAVFLASQIFLFFLLTFNLAIVLNLIFAVILMAFLLHHQSREYVKVWFH